MILLRNPLVLVEYLLNFKVTLIEVPYSGKMGFLRAWAVYSTVGIPVLPKSNPSILYTYVHNYYIIINMYVIA